MFVAFYTINLYICVFTTCFTSFCLHDTLMDPRTVCTCIYVRMYVYVCTMYAKKNCTPCIFLRMYVCIYMYGKTIPHTFLRILCHAKSLFVNQGILVTFQPKPTGIHDIPPAHYTSQVCLMSWRWLLWQTSDSVGLRAAKVMCALRQET